MNKSGKTDKNITFMLLIFIVLNKFWPSVIVRRKRFLKLLDIFFFSILLLSCSLRYKKRCQKNGYWRTISIGAVKTVFIRQIDMLRQHYIQIQYIYIYIYVCVCVCVCVCDCHVNFSGMPTPTTVIFLIEAGEYRHFLIISFRRNTGWYKCRTLHTRSVPILFFN